MPNRPGSVILSHQTNQQTIIEIAASRRLEPFRQGSLDGLCGLVSTINGIRLVLADCAPLSKSRAKDLFAEGIKFLHRKSGLHAAVLSGMGKQRRLALARYLAKQVSTTNYQVIVEQPDHSAWTEIADVFRYIEGSLAQQMPILVMLTGGLEHFTTIAASSHKLLHLADSNGQRFIRKSSCGLTSDSFYQIPPNGLLRIRVHRPG